MRDRWRARRQSVARVAVALALGAHLIAARPADADAVPYRLQPQAMEVMQRLCARLRPHLHCGDVRIERDYFSLRLCDAGAGARCFAVRLEHAGPDCPEDIWGPFCARFPHGRPAAGRVAALADALQADATADPWTAPEPPPTAPAATPSPLKEARGDPTVEAVPSLAVTASSLFIAALLCVVPIGLGWRLGRAWRRARRRRVDGWAAALLLLLVPAAALLLLDAHLGLIGAWDALLIGLGSGAGLVLALHRAAADWRPLILLVASSLILLALAEVGSRLFLPPPPAFPSSAGPTLWLSDAVRSARAAGLSAMQIGQTTCAAIYGDGISGTALPIAFPTTWQPRADAAQHILHLGDSMVFGSPTDGRFTDDLARLEPHVEHVNAAIAGTAPDVSLALARHFVAAHDLTAVVIYLTGNDFWGIDDGQYACSDWQPLLVYEPERTRLRFATAQPGGEHGRLWRSVQLSPPPYVLRATLRFSALAAHVAAALVQLDRRATSSRDDTDDATRVAHLRAVLRDARDELAARRIPLIVVSFRARATVEAGQFPDAGSEEVMRRIAQQLGIVTLDTWQPLREAVEQGAHPFTNAGGPTDSHFSPTGHARIAAWLHQQLPDAIARARGGGEPTATP